MHARMITVWQCICTPADWSVRENQKDHLYPDARKPPYNLMYVGASNDIMMNLAVCFPPMFIEKARY